MTANTLSSPALTALRNATRAEHAELDQLSPLTRDSLNTTEYLQHAARVLGWMRPVERAIWQGPLAAKLPESLAPGQRNVKSAWLEQDLAAAGLPRQDLDALPECPYIPVPRSLPEAFGMAYVVEGATLGGTFLLRRLAPRLPGASLLWLQGYGERTGACWKDFLRLLERHVASDADITVAAAGALRTFQSFRRWVIDEADAIQR